MSFQLISVVISSIFLLLPSTISFGPVAKHGCPDQCGNLSIQYPFGVGMDCSLDPSFNISCINSTSMDDPPKAYITILDKEVIEINETYVRVKYPNFVASACYGLPGYNEPVNLSGTQYTLSSENWLTAIGCDSMVMGTDQPNGSLVGSSSCTSFCGERNHTGGDGYCPDNGFWSVLGNGCCRSPINGGSSFLKAELTDLSGELVGGRVFPCSYAFIQESRSRSGNHSAFSYKLEFLQNNSKAFSDEFMETKMAPVPVVRLNWRIGNKNCSQQLSNDTSYACRDNRSICVDKYQVDGYYCSCFQGYKGNPYLNGGCQEAYSVPVAKPGCLDQCGNLSIPYPFGIGPNCYMDPSFEISCNASTNPPKAYLSILKAEIYDLNQSQIRVNYPNLGFSCNSSERQSLIIDLSETQFTLSTKNVLTALGCDDMVVAAYGKASNASFVGGSCAASCSTSSNDIDDYGSCARFYTFSTGLDWFVPAVGCCQTPISRGIAYLEANLTDLSGKWRRGKLYPCSYAFIAEKTSFVFYPFEYLSNSTAPIFTDYYIEPVLVLDWRIGKENCNVAKTKGNAFGCKANTRCVDFDGNVGGYLCECLKGYQGNPYLGQGCQVDIDECGDDTTNPCNSNSICINTPGSVTCVCPRGFYGDGRKDGTACIQVTQSKSKTIILTGMGSALGISQMSCSIVKEEFDDDPVFEAKPISFSDIEYSWTASYKSLSASSSDAHPLMHTT
ncbi:hypothetical protein SASPL_103627 [Salvia splendens]|uniref:EGF-like domain-containing protein n=1 Tax=Salvia splendens TaxID=180675 RepID=A0A8X8YIE5_SALSN|nr:hypothetical protein SASPL_103627 [Salvia splendens]